MKRIAINKAMEAALLKGIPFVILNYRGGGVEQIKFLSDKTQKEATFELMTLKCEAQSEDGDQIKVSRDLTEDEKKQGWQNAKPGFSRGDQIFALIGGMVKAKGQVTIRAISVEKVED